MANKMFRIRSLTETDFDTDESLYWSNTYGWADKGSADLCTEDELPGILLVGSWTFEEV